MSKNPLEDPYKQKFRPDADAKLDAQVDDVLGDLSLDKLYEFDKAQPAESTSKGMRRGKIVSIDADDAFVDLGGKSQGIVSLLQFPGELPKIGDELEFNVDRYDPSEGLLIPHASKAAKATQRLLGNAGGRPDRRRHRHRRQQGRP